MPNLIGGGSTIPTAHNAAEGGATQARTGNGNSHFGVARNANDFRNATVGGEPITPTASAGQLSAVFVQEINLPSMCQVVYSVDSHWTDDDFNQFVIGSDLEFSDPAIRGFGQDAGLPTMYISGMTFEARPESSGQALLTVVAFDKMHWLRFGTRTKPFVNQTDKQIFEAVLSSLSQVTLSADEMPSDKQYPYVLQDNETDYDFLMRRCEEGNYECLVQVQGGQEKFIVRPCAQGKNPPANLALVYRQDIEAISLDLRVPTAGSPTTAWGYDVQKGVWVSGTYDKNEEKDEMKGVAAAFQYTRPFATTTVPLTLRRPDLKDEGTLTYAAQATRTRRQNVFIEGTATLRDINLKTTAGVNVAVQGVNAFFDGWYYIYKSTHERDRQGDRTVLGLRRSGI
jgi:hypothetical protein